jgi:hypothetical protein
MQKARNVDHHHHGQTKGSTPQSRLCNKYCAQRNAIHDLAQQAKMGYSPPYFLRPSTSAASANSHNKDSNHVKETAIKMPLQNHTEHILLELWKNLIV